MVRRSDDDSHSTASSDSPVPELCEREQYDSSVSSDSSCDGSIDSGTLDSSIRSCPETDDEDTVDDSGVECRTQDECPPSAEANGNIEHVVNDQRGNDVDHDTLRNRLRDKIRTARDRLSRREAHNIQYAVNIKAKISKLLGCLVDRGANGCIIGYNMTIVSRSDKFIDLTGIEDHTVRQLNIVHAACVVETHLGLVILHIHQGAYMPDAKSILSPLQMEACGCTIMDKAAGVNEGEQPYVQSADGYRFPLKMRQGLMYADVRPVRDEEWDQLPHVHLTTDNEWDPSIYDHELVDDWKDSFKDPVEDHYKDRPYDRFGNVKATEEDEPIATTRSEIETNFTASIQDELIGSVIEYYVDGEIFHCEPNSDDDSYTWEDFRTLQNHQWEAYGVDSGTYNTKDGLRRSSRLRTSDSSQNSKDLDTPSVHKTGSGTDGKRGTTPSVATAPTVPTSLDSDSDTEPREDYNNPAKSTTQNEIREYTGGPRLAKPSKINYKQFRKYLGGAPVKVVEQTFRNTTQMGRLGAVEGTRLWKRHKAPNPALNVPRRNEPVATDTIYGAGCPAVDNGSTAAQFFVGRKSGFCAVEGLGRSDKRYPAALMNHIRKYGAMDQIISDNAKAQISTRVEEILNLLQIKDWTSEAYNKNLNFAERCWQDCKNGTELILNYSGAPAYTWLLALKYKCFLKNHTAHESLGWRTPSEWLLGYTPDISVLLIFVFWEPVYYAVNEATWPEDPHEALGRFVGIADTVGAAVTFKILTEDMKVIARSVVRTATKPGVFQNLRANERAPRLAPKPVTNTLHIDGQHEKVRVETVSDEDGESDDEDDDTPGIGYNGTKPEAVLPEKETFLSTAMEDAVKNGGDLPTINIDDIIGRTFITSPDSDGEQVRAQIEEASFLQQRTADEMEPLIKFQCKVGNKRFEEIMTYNKMLQWCNQHRYSDEFYVIESIIGHRQKRGRGGRRSNQWEVHVQWASGLSDWNDLNQIFADDPVTVSQYAKRNNLLEKEGWKRCKRYAKREKVIGRMINQVRLKNFRNKP